VIKGFAKLKHWLRVNPKVKAAFDSKLATGAASLKNVKLDDLINSYKKSYSYVKNWHKHAGVKKSISNVLSHIDENKIMNFTQSRFGKVAAGVGVSVVGYNIVKSRFGHSKGKSPKIPSQHDEGFHIMKEQLTDFGSPISLAKTMKTIMPYKSSVRKGIITSVAAKTDNLALKMAKTAIRHTDF